MARRGWGVMVLVVTLAVAVVVPAAFGLRNAVVGTAMRSPIPSPPVVGECALAAVDANGSALQYMEGSVGLVPLGACSDGPSAPQHHNFGEITSVTQDQASFPRTGNGRNPDPWSCRAAADDYLHWPDKTWAPVPSRSVQLVGPDISQYLTGQRWIACLISPGEEGYHGSIRDDRNPSAANAYGQCRETDGTEWRRLSCAEPHSVEIFGTAAITDPAAVIDSCADLLIAVTGLPDPTAGGQLEVTILADRYLGRRNCAVQVVGDRALDESLLGWGSAPLPLS